MLDRNNMNVAQIVGLYLPLTQTFIYEYLRKVKRFRSEVFTEEIHNLDLFPLGSINLVKRTGAEKVIDKILKPFAGHQILHDLKYLNLFGKKKIGLIHAHFGWNAVRMLTIKGKMDIRLVTTFYGADMSVLPNQAYYKVAYQELFETGDLFLVEGNNMQNDLARLGCPREKIRIQHIGIDLDKFNSKTRTSVNEDETTIILMCSSFVEKKGIEIGIQAFERALDYFKNIELHIIGDGILRKKLEDLIKDLRIDGKVKLFGYQNHEFYRAELNKAQIFMAPSFTASDGDSEGGAPTVLIEAQASGLPILSTYHADIPEVVLDGTSGFLVPEKDIDALAEKLLLLLEHPELRRKMGLAGREHVEKNYNIFHEAGKLEQVYCELLEAPSVNMVEEDSLEKLGGKNWI